MRYQVDIVTAGPFTGRLRGRIHRVVVHDGGGTRYVVADVGGRRVARRLRADWTLDLHDGVAVHDLAVPDGVPGRLRPDLLDPEGFGDVLPDEIAG